MEITAFKANLNQVDTRTQYMVARFEAPITGLILEGFQAIAKRTAIPFGRITIAVGPNSAGKSAILDAIEIYNTLISDPECKQPRYQSASLKSKLERHWRRDDEKGSLCSRMTLAVERRLDFDLRESIAEEIERSVRGKVSRPLHSTVQHEWVFLRDVRAENHLLIDRVRYRLKVNETVLLEAADSGISLNIKHPSIDGIRFRVNFQKIAEKYPTLCSYATGVFRIPKRVYGFSISSTSGENPLTYLPFGLFKKKDDPEGLAEESAAGEGAPDDMRRVLAEISEIAAGLTSATCASPQYNPSLVPASRQVPTQKDLTFHLQQSQFLYPIAEEENLSLGGMEEYRSLAESALQDWLIESSKSKRSNSESSSLLKGVNSALSNHLFLEKGYRISCSVRSLLDEHATQMRMQHSEIQDYFLGADSFLVELRLKDSIGRVHRFEDVGSGIGYVLPVLISMNRGPGLGSTSIIQQPELHLHPALQAALADTFLDGSSSGNNVVIETHSEYIILRILRRVRQTSLKIQIAKELSIYPDDVFIVYFNPKPTGETEIKRLRISEDGEFLDRWPRGFFAERDVELFDE